MRKGSEDSEEVKTDFNFCSGFLHDVSVFSAFCFLQMTNILIPLHSMPEIKVHLQTEQVRL